MPKGEPGSPPKKAGLHLKWLLKSPNFHTRQNANLLDQIRLVLTTHSGKFLGFQSFKEMVGIFSKFSVIRSGHRRSQTSREDTGVIAPNVDAIDADHVASHGIQVGIEFKPVEHPIEPLDSDQPVLCSLPEPSILNDGRLWKERVSAASTRMRIDSSIRSEGIADSDDSVRRKPNRLSSNKMISYSQSAPEQNFLDLLEECNTSQN